jgi:hypothetical protein
LLRTLCLFPRQGPRRTGILLLAWPPAAMSRDLYFKKSCLHDGGCEPQARSPLCGAMRSMREQGGLYSSSSERIGVPS